MPFDATSKPREERRVVNREFASVEEFILEYVTNISRSGAFIRSTGPLPVGRRVSLRFSVVMDELEIIEGWARSCASCRPAGPSRRGWASSSST
jgi:hypothetical protein